MSDRRNRNRAGAIVAAASLLGVLLLAFTNMRRESPGPISAVHAGIESLAGGSSCAACHGGWFGNMQRACTECHQDIAAQLTERKGLHGSLEPMLGGACSTCHSEHHGTDFQLVNRLAFAQAGVPDPLRFDHARVGFELAGAHTALECSECHRNAEVAVLSEGQKRYLGIAQDCASCHENPHGGRMQLHCTSCHSQDRFDVRSVANHDRFLPLDGPHRDVGCRECHQPGTAHALEAMATAEHREARGCGDCHDAPHSAAFLLGNAGHAAGCATCHPLDHPTFDDARVTVDAAQHAHSGFALSHPHQGLECASCHAPELPYAERHRSRAATDCRACHVDPHGGQFDNGPFAAEGCLSCHSATHFAPHEFDLEHHARSSFALDGAHERLDCARCHADPEVGQARQFDGTQTRCEQCHVDAHDGAFAVHAATLATNPRGTCAECHRTSAFHDVDLTAFHHQKHTGFGLDGAHGQMPCTDCHARTAEPDRYGRRFGRIAAHRDATAGCTACHDDPHGGQFDTAEVPPAIDGRTGCARCHDTVSFRALPHGFDHARFTGFDLIGRHAELDCAACHPLLPAPDASGRESQRARGTECADCHADPHQQQFVRLGKNDCARCHKSFEAFARLSFRHNLDSRFHLGDAHRDVPCASCHKPELFGAVTAIRYRPLRFECVDCHGTDRPRRRK